MAYGNKTVVNNNSGGGVGFAGLLAILFIALKLTGMIAWSWWWVLSPLWISAIVFVFIVLVALVVLLAKGK